MDTKDILISARAVISNGWTQHIFAANNEGHAVPTWFQSATCFCAIGAVRRVLSILPYRERKMLDEAAVVRLLHNTAKQLGYASVAMFNDDPTTRKEDVLAVFDLTIERL